MTKQMMKLMVGIVLAGTVWITSSPAQAGASSAWQGSAVSGNWTDANWSNVGAGGYPGDGSNTPSDAFIGNGGTVTLNQSINLGSGGWNSHVTIGASTSGGAGALVIDGNYSLTGIGEFHAGTYANSTITQSDGAVQIAGVNQVKLSGEMSNSNLQNYQATWSLSGGSLTVTSTPAIYTIGYPTGANNRGYLNISGTGSFVGGNGTLAVRQADITVSGNGSFSHAGTLAMQGGNTTATATNAAISLTGGIFDVGTLTMTTTAATDSRITITGNTHTKIEIDTLSAYNPTAGGSATITFVLNSSGQVTGITTTELNLSATQSDNADIVIDANALGRGTSVAVLALIDYVNALGFGEDFNSVTVLGDPGLTYSGYDIAYDLGGGDLAFVLQDLYMIPEPASGFLLLFGGLLFMRRRARR